MNYVPFRQEPFHTDFRQERVSPAFSAFIAQCFGFLL
jgi:hypothetical protein